MKNLQKYGRKNNMKNHEQGTVLYVVIPCYNEQEVLPITAPKFKEQLDKLIEKGLISRKSKILFVDDGSKDTTWMIIQEFSRKDTVYIGIKQSRNRGHQNAVLAGLMEAKNVADITITVDCDGQDDINAMEQMIKDYYDGSDIVYGVRSSRTTDTFFKRFSAEAFYKFLNLMGAEVIYNHADYRLVTSRVLKEFANYREVNLFLRGMFPLVGFKSSIVYYERHERLAGESHYPLRKMLALAFDGITSLSIKPIRFITIMGICVALLSFGTVIWTIVQHFMGHTVQGWTSMTSVICLLGGIQLICIGILGEYIGKIYLEVKARPRYIISERTDEGLDDRK